MNQTKEALSIEYSHNSLLLSCFLPCFFVQLIFSVAIAPIIKKNQNKTKQNKTKAKTTTKKLSQVKDTYKYPNLTTFTVCSTVKALSLLLLQAVPELFILSNIHRRLVLPHLLLETYLKEASNDLIQVFPSKNYSSCH